MGLIQTAGVSLFLCDHDLREAYPFVTKVYAQAPSRLSTSIYLWIKKNLLTDKWSNSHHKSRTWRRIKIHWSRDSLVVRGINIIFARPYLHKICINLHIVHIPSVGQDITITMMSYNIDRHISWGFPLTQLQLAAWGGAMEAESYT